MTSDGCEEMQLLVQADVDGELQPAEAARVGAHLMHCAECAQVQTRLLALSTRLRQDAPRYAAPAALRARFVPKRPSCRVPALAFGAGFAIAACLALVMVLPRGGALPDAVVFAHIRALQPGHLMDVVSTDQHTVKPWFDGKLPFAPPVKDFQAEGFPLVGGRVDYLAGRTAAALVYRSRQHVIDLFAWPGVDSRLPSSGARAGYNFQRWSQDGMSFWAVSDLNAGELGDFVRDFRKP
ncbi:anti-sigma factor [Acidisphaera sp. L21]|uniref:anti-sigma factor family protein n=1 Tax=Acidisphaera sp. L21 TaxID=1641851 RepID=UPI001C205F1B|nr:zf-HC2 domain-containing protein [Acidisphaera sp. L21]